MKKQLSFDIQQYHRRLLLATYFRFEEGSDPPPFTHKSAWMPKLSQVPNTVRKIIRADKYAIKNLPWNHREHANLNVEEQQALLQLRRDNSIVIKPADKGSATVIMDREAYIKEAERQLNQEEYYKKLPEPIFLETVPLVRTILTQLREGGHINKKQETYLIGPDNPRQRFFYLLPKIHKSPESWSVPYEMPPGRPIVSDCGSETYATAEYIEHFLNPISTRHPSYIKDTYDFIDKIKNITLPQECLLFTIDIDSLYTNIETSAGLEAIKDWFIRYPDENRPDEHLIKLLEINLTKNDFEFDSKFYLQVKGTAMGKRFAPSYANIFMAKWEEAALGSWPTKPVHYFRFLDDIWGVWSGTEEEFKQFAAHLNTGHCLCEGSRSPAGRRLSFGPGGPRPSPFRERFGGAPAVRHACRPGRVDLVPLAVPLRGAPPCGESATSTVRLYPTCTASHFALHNSSSDRRAARGFAGHLPCDIRVGSSVLKCAPSARCLSAPSSGELPESRSPSSSPSDMRGVSGSDTSRPLSLPLLPVHFVHGASGGFAVSPDGQTCKSVLFRLNSFLCVSFLFPYAVVRFRRISLLSLFPLFRH
ncbi:hypothetical protein MHYP_G00320620 [Metynnis hypsauchen]